MMNLNKLFQVQSKRVSYEVIMTVNLYQVTKPGCKKQKKGALFQHPHS